MPCLANACHQGRAACPAPMTCSGAVPLVDESIDLFTLHRLQEVRSVDERWDPPKQTRYSFAPGVIDKGDEDSDFLKQENALTAMVRIALPYLAAVAAVALLVGRALLGWI